MPHQLNLHLTLLPSSTPSTNHRSQRHCLRRHGDFAQALIRILTHQSEQSYQTYVRHTGSGTRNLFPHPITTLTSSLAHICIHASRFAGNGVGPFILCLRYFASSTPTLSLLLRMFTFLSIRSNSKASQKQTHCFPKEKYH